MPMTPLMISNEFIIIVIGMVFLLSLPLLVFLAKTVQNITPYLYMNARLKAKEGRLISKVQLEDMLSAHSLSEITSLLEGTPYGSEMQGLMVSNAETLEEVLQKHRITLYGEIMGMLPAKIRDVFSYLNRELEANTIKSTPEGHSRTEACRTDGPGNCVNRRIPRRNTETHV